MGANFDSKKQIVSEIKEKISSAKSIIFTDYRGITVAQDTTLRKKLREAGVSYKVYKNRLLKIAFDELGMSDAYDVKMLEGTTSVAFGPDEVSAANILCPLVKEYGLAGVKFGVVNGKYTDAEGIEKLSKIPSKDVLIAMLMGMLNAPMSALARALNEIAKKNA